MTKITIKYSGDRIVSIASDGHANSADYGEDIVCAAISVLMQTAVNSLEAVAEIKFIFEMSEAYMYIELPKELDEMKQLKADVILKTIETGLQGISSEYPKYIKLYKKGGANIQ